MVRLIFISPFHIRISDAEFLPSLPEAKDLWQNSALVLTTAAERFWRRILVRTKVKDPLSINTYLSKARFYRMQRVHKN